MALIYFSSYILYVTRPAGYPRVPSDCLRHKKFKKNKIREKNPRHGAKGHAVMTSLCIRTPVVL